ncbi:DNA sulfur modification protein DndD [Bacillus cereus]|uniref:DNA sulfur modification protein DndD n=1 Tax=Bacillus cereus TaxID=1396 RepID=UPI000D898F6C|nr:DNA sulfur modification protein DndD [Bacillus cereus]PYD99993.1 DNA sulfur modification protein DndD [Bacillus cereus]
MKYNKFSCYNYGPYYGNTEIDFSVDLENDLTVIIIHADNGNGKTSIINGTKLALHGKNANLTQNETYNQFLFERINEQSREEGNTQAWVEVELVGKEEIDGEEFELTLRVRRKWKIISDRETHQDVFVYKNDVLTDFSTEEELNTFINSYISHEVIQFFAFDAEKIRYVADESNDVDELSNDINNTLNISPYLQTEVLLERFSEKQRRVLLSNQTNMNTAAIEAERTRLEEEKEYLIKESKKNQSLQEKKKNELKRKRKWLMEHGYKGEQDRTKLEWKLDSLKEAKEDIELQFTNFSSETLPYLILLDEMGEVEEQLELEYRLSSQVMSYRENLEKKTQHINKVLGNDTASPLLEAQKKELLSRINESWEDLFPAEHHLTPLYHFEAIPNKEFEGFVKRFKEKMQDIHGTATDAKLAFSKYDELLDVVKQLEYQITNLPTSEQTDKQDKECRRLASEIDTINNMLKEIEDKVLMIDEKLSKYEQELQELRFQIRRNREIKARLEVGELVLSLYGEFISQLKLEKAKAIEQRAEGMFHKLTHKDANKFKFSIDEGTFALSLLRTDGTPRPKRLLSEAEKQIYGLSITFALGTSSIREFGFMIDSPFGKLDKKHRKNVIHKFIPIVSSQVILLSHDEEITPEYREELLPYIAKEYTIKYHGNNAMVIEGYKL